MMAFKKQEQSNGIDAAHAAQRRTLLKQSLTVLGGVFVGASPWLMAGAQNKEPTTSAPVSAQSKDSIAVLNDFLKNVNTLKANFTQVVVSPKNDRTRTSSGTFVLSRPNRFRFDYLKPYEQQIVSDGKNLWLYDKDLEQVTQRAYDEALDSTPAALLAGGASATMAQESFTLQSLPDANGMQWVEAKPKQQDGQINVAKIGFKNGELAVLEITDNFRQKSTLSFINVQTNPTVSNTLFDFKVPAGVDLINE